MATPIVLKKPLKVYKVGTAKTLGIFISLYQNFRYYKSQTMPTVKIEPKFERCRSVMGCVGELWNYLIKIVSIKDNYIYYICLDKNCITRDYSYIYDIEDWEKITPHQFKDAYLAVMKDFQDPDFEERPESNWNKVLNSIVTSVNN